MYKIFKLLKGPKKNMEALLNIVPVDPAKLEEKAAVRYTNMEKGKEGGAGKSNKPKGIKNKGTGAGGSNTNKNGLSYEGRTDLGDKIDFLEKNKFSRKVKFDGSEKMFLQTNQANLFREPELKDEIDTNIEKAHGCKNPDECYVDTETKNMFIIEKKFQQCSGSVCEKIQTPDFKIWQYSRTFPNYNIIYIYCLSDWFKKNCVAELEYLDFKKIPYFWGSSETYKDDLIKFILNY